MPTQLLNIVVIFFLNLMLCSCPLARADSAQDASFGFPSKSHKAGELKNVNGIALLQVSGSPEEIGEQIGVLAIQPAKRLVQLPDELLKKRNIEYLRPVLSAVGKAMLPRFPEHHLREMEAMAKWGKVDVELLTIVNTIDDR